MNDIILFAMARENLSDKVMYLFKGLLFIPFLETASRKAGGDKDVSLVNEAGDDIYPLF
ncbi:MAG: hypothetical protein L7F78_14055 [Syntrophales bacterium LBB04]|nr:hypothetical protein [Syntrophales bacterium LBB04]